MGVLKLLIVLTVNGQTELTVSHPPTAMQPVAHRTVAQLCFIVRFSYILHTFPFVRDI